MVLEQQISAQDFIREFHVACDNGKAFTCKEGESVLLAMQRLGIPGVVIGCRGGGCGVCRVRVTQGQYRLGKISRSYVNEAEIAQGIVLACRLYPESDIEMILSVPKAGAGQDR
jgi:ferredoxin